MDTPVRLGLLLSQDTSARLQYVLAAILPYLNELTARASLKHAVDC